MKKLFLTGLVIGIACIPFYTLQAQNDSSRFYPTYRVAIFAPLYLDSIFSNNNFKYTDAVPKFIIPSIEFIQGAQIAFDSILLGRENVKAAIYDSKSYTEPINLLIKNKKLDSLDLIIGSVKDIDYKLLADFALLNKIPFISATYPNDGGVIGNPFTVIMNSTLKSHCEAIYSYLLQNHGTDLIFLCRKKGSQEDKIAAYFKSLNEQDGKALLNIKTLNTDSIFTSDVLKTKLDCNRQNVIIGGSLEESFASNITTASFGLFPTYPITLIGMPNWDAFASLHKKDDYIDFPIYFTSPYYNNKQDNYSKLLTAAYSKKYKIKPSDMAFKGFESVMLFTKLLIKYPNQIIYHLNDKTVKIFCDYNFKPVILKKENAIPDYLENKHLYFIKLLNGMVSKAW